MSQTAHTEGFAFTVPAQEIEKVSLQFSAEEIEIHSAAADEITIQKMYKDGTPYTGDRPMIMDLEAGVLCFRNTPAKLRPFPDRSVIILYVPDNYSGSLTVEAHSGAIMLMCIRGASLACSVRSGHLRLHDCRFQEKIKVSARSGCLDLEKVTAPALQLECFSGTIRCRETECTDFVSEIHSGKQDVEVQAAQSCRLSARSGKLRFCGQAPCLETSTKSGPQYLETENLEKADMTAISGSITLAVHEAPRLDEINLRLVSGQAALSLPSDVMPAVSIPSRTGRLRCDRDAFSADGRSVRINAGIKSGSLRIIAH